jgi:hypothetical protein
MTKGDRRLRWQNMAGGGLSLEGYAISDDPEWKPFDIRLPKPAAGDRYFVENVREELDCPGEWYLDRRAGVLYYRPASGFSERSEVIAPTVGRVIEILGDAKRGQAVRHLRFAGLVIHDTDYSPDDGCAGYGMGNNGVVYLGHAEQYVIENCTFRNTGKYAVCLAGGRKNRVQGNQIADSAEGGVLLRSAGNLVADNHIHHLGAVYKHIGGVILEGAGTDDNRVAHNWIHDSSRYGISLKNPGRPQPVLARRRRGGYRLGRTRILRPVARAGLRPALDRRRPAVRRPRARQLQPASRFARLPVGLPADRRAQRRAEKPAGSPLRRVIHGPIVTRSVSEDRSKGWPR